MATTVGGSRPAQAQIVGPCTSTEVKVRGTIDALAGPEAAVPGAAVLSYYSPPLGYRGYDTLQRDRFFADTITGIVAPPDREICDLVLSVALSFGADDTGGLGGNDTISLDVFDQSSKVVAGSQYYTPLAHEKVDAAKLDTAEFHLKALVGNDAADTTSNFDQVVGATSLSVVVQDDTPVDYLRLEIFTRPLAAACIEGAAIVGGIDNYVGVQPSAPSPGLKLAYPAPLGYRDFDSPVSNEFLEHTFSGFQPPAGQTIVGGRLSVALSYRSSAALNDNLTLDARDPVTGAALISQPFSAPLSQLGFADGTPSVITFDLNALVGGGATSMLDGLNHYGLLDVIIQDDTPVDYLCLDLDLETVPTACDGGTVVGGIDGMVGPEPTSPSAELMAAWPAVASGKGFDRDVNDRWVGHTFSGLVAPPGHEIYGGLLTAGLRTNDLDNDSILLDAANGAGSLLPNIYETQLSYHGVSLQIPATFTLNLDKLTGGTVTSMLDAIRTRGRLDVIIQDDTLVDYLCLRLLTRPIGTVTLDKKTNDMDDATLTPGTAVIWTYTITNSSPHPMSLLSLVDEPEGVIDLRNCEGSVTILRPGQSVTCVKRGTARNDRYCNTATIVVDLLIPDPAGVPLRKTVRDTSCYSPRPIKYPNLTSLQPARLVDTREGGSTTDGQQAGSGRVKAKVVAEVQVAGRGNVPADATAALLNVTAVEPSGAGFLTAFPCGSPVPNASNVNYVKGQVVPNAVLAKIGTAGKVCVYTEAETHLIVDVNGFVPVGGSPSTVNPARLVDTREGGSTTDGQQAGSGRVKAKVVAEVRVAARGNVPADATAVLLNVTAVEPSGPGFLTVFPCGSPVPNASNVNYVKGQVVPNAVLAKIGTAGKVCVFTEAETHLIVDVNGFIPNGGSPSTVNPARLVDTREGGSTTDGQQAGSGRIKAKTVAEIQVAGRGNIPTDAAAVMLNVTAVEPSGPGYLTVFPCGSPVPNASNVNYVTGQVVPNAVLAKVGVAGKVCVYTEAETHLIVDVNGFIAAP
jgi:transglutaminase-like putative cysteine protease